MCKLLIKGLCDVTACHCHLWMLLTTMLRNTVQLHTYSM